MRDMAGANMEAWQPSEDEEQEGLIHWAEIRVITVPAL